MIKAILISFCLLLLGALRPPEDAKEIVRKAEERVKGKTSLADVTIQIVRPTWSREMKMRAWTKGNQLSMIMITAPVKDAGTVFLKRTKEVWNWMPSIERTIKLPPSMMSQSWMGTDFTNDDLVKESSIVDDYEHTIVGDSVLLGRTCWKIQLIPKPGAAVIWGKIYTWVDKKDYMQLRGEFYDEEGLLVNSMNALNVKMLGGRMLPSRMEMIPADKKGNKTVMINENIVFDKEISDDFFSVQNMKKVK